MSEESRIATHDPLTEAQLRDWRAKLLRHFPLHPDWINRLCDMAAKSLPSAITPTRETINFENSPGGFQDLMDEARAESGEATPSASAWENCTRCGAAILSQHPEAEETVSASASAKVPNTPIETLLKSYEDEGCDHSKLDWVALAAMRYVQTMEDSQVRCLLYVLAKAASASGSTEKGSVFQTSREPAAWLEVHEGSGEVLDATLIKPDGGEPGLRYEPLYSCIPSANVSRIERAYCAANDYINALTQPGISAESLEKIKRDYFRAVLAVTPGITCAGCSGTYEGCPTPEDCLAARKSHSTDSRSDHE